MIELIGINTIMYVKSRSNLECMSTYLCHVYDYIVIGAFRRGISLARAIRLYDQKLVLFLIEKVEDA